MSKLEASWNVNYIILSYSFSFAGSYVGVCLSEQYRLCGLDGPIFLTKNQILFLLSVSTGGVAIWAMHFIGMGAISLHNPENIDDDLKVKFDTGLTVSSLIAPIFCLYVGLFIATNDRVFVRDSMEFGELLMADARRFSIKDAKSKSKLRMLALFKGLTPIIIGGILTGAGVCVMHFVGMTAMVCDATMSWDIGIVAASVVIAVVVSVVALWIMLRLLPLYPNSELLRVLCAAVMGIAVCGMHYTGMNAPTFFSTSTPVRYTSTLTLESSTAVLSAMFIGIVLIAICVILLAADMRIRSKKNAKQLRLLEDLLQNMRNLTTAYPDCVVDVLDKCDKLVEKKSSVENRSATSLFRPLNFHREAIDRRSSTSAGPAIDSNHSRKTQEYFQDSKHAQQPSRHGRLKNSSIIIAPIEEIEIVGDEKQME